MINVVVGNSGGIETKTFRTLKGFRFALPLLQRDRRYLFISAKCGGNTLYGAIRGVPGVWAARKWGQGGTLAKLGLTGVSVAQCRVCQMRVIPVLGACPFCEIDLTSGVLGV
jgi:hypothetical protein